MHGIKEVDPHGTETIYMCKDFLLEHVQGFLQVQVRAAPSFAVLLLLLTLMQQMWRVQLAICED